MPRRTFVPVSLAMMLVLVGCATAPSAKVSPRLPDQMVSEKPIAGPPLFYPASARAQRIRGTATVECTVKVWGGTRGCVVTSSSNPAFAEEGLYYVSKSRYLPEIRNGAPVEVRHRWALEFDPDQPAPPQPPAMSPQPVPPLTGSAGPPLSFPPEMQAQGIGGVVTIECIVSTEGRTRDCFVTSSSNPAFEGSALEYVEHSRYSPAVRHGVPVEVQHEWTITFALK